MVKDVIGREIAIGNVVFYNGQVYRVKNFAKDGKRVALNYATGWQLVKDKIKVGVECCLIEDSSALTMWLLKTGK